MSPSAVAFGSTVIAVAIAVAGMWINSGLHAVAEAILELAKTFVKVERLKAEAEQ